MLTLNYHKDRSALWVWFWVLPSGSKSFLGLLLHKFVISALFFLSSRQPILGYVPRYLFFFVFNLRWVRLSLGFQIQVVTLRSHSQSCQRLFFGSPGLKSFYRQAPWLPILAVSWTKVR